MAAQISGPRMYASRVPRIMLRILSLALVSLLAACASTGGKSVRGGGNSLACMTRVMYFESNRSSEDGMLAVGSVVMNRVSSDKFPNTVCGVVGQNKQFAPGVLSKPMKEGKSKALAEKVARDVLRGKRHREVGPKVMFFHTVGYSFPYDNMHYQTMAGGNIFYEKRKAQPGQRNTTQIEVAQRFNKPKARPQQETAIAAAPPPHNAPQPVYRPAVATARAAPPPPVAWAPQQPVYPAPYPAASYTVPGAGSIEDLIALHGG